MLISNAIFAQNYFTDAYIILKDQSDTLKGQINDKNWDVNPNEIQYKSADLGEKTYNIKELKAFGVANREHYIIKKVDLDITPFKFADLQKSTIMITVKDTILALRVFLKADMSLLYLKETSQKEHFFYLYNEEVKELIFHKYIKSKNEKDYEVSNKMYQKQIGFLFADCNQNIKTENLEFDQIELVNAFIKFNDCLGCSSTCYIKSKVDKPTYSLDLIVGSAQYLQGEYYRDYFERISDYNKKNLFTPIIGLGGNIYSKRNHGNNILSLQVWFQNQKFTGFPSENSIRFNSLNTTIVYKKRLNFSSKIKPYYGGGVNVKFNFNPTIKPSRVYGLYDFAKVQESIIGEIGMELSRFNFLGRLTVNMFSPNVLMLEYKNVAEVEVRNTNSRIGSQLIICYRLK